MIYFNNYEFKNNLDYSVLGQAVKSEKLLATYLTGVLVTSIGPVATTQTRYAAVGNTTPTTEFIDATGKNLLIASVSDTVAEQFILKGQSISDNSTYELTGLVLGAKSIPLYYFFRSIVYISLIGFEETARLHHNLQIIENGTNKT